jgi:hypothetical protein
MRIHHYFQIHILGQCWGKSILMINRKEAFATWKKIGGLGMGGGGVSLCCKG